MRPCVGSRIKCSITSVVCPSVPSLWLSRNVKALETSNVVDQKGQLKSSQPDLAVFKNKIKQYLLLAHCVSKIAPTLKRYSSNYKGQFWWNLAKIFKRLLYPFSRYWALNILGSRVWPFGITWRHRPLTLWFPVGRFLLVVIWNQASLTVSEIFNGEYDAMVGMTLIDL